MTLEELIATVPIREFRGRPFYVRVRDIPPPWDAQFSRALYGANCPGFLYKRDFDSRRKYHQRVYAPQTVMMSRSRLKPPGISSHSADANSAKR